jgi:lysophospholipase L1-like esterase
MLRSMGWRRALTVAASLAVVTVAEHAHAAAPIKVVCVGDSITHRGDKSLEYPTYVQDTLGADFEVTNCGHNGGLLTEQPSRSGDYYRKTSEYQACRDAVPAPDILTVMLGTNDSGYWDQAESTYAPEYLKLAEAFRQGNPKLKVVAATSPAASANWNDTGLIRGTLIRDEIAPLVRTLAELNHYTLADVNQATSGWMTNPDYTTWDSKYFVDAGVHPNEAGARAIAEVFVTAILAAAEPEPEPEPSGGAAGTSGIVGVGGVGGSAVTESAGMGGAGSGGGAPFGSAGGPSAPGGTSATPSPVAGASADGSSIAPTPNAPTNDASCAYNRAHQRDNVAITLALLGLILLHRRERLRHPRA